MPAALDGGPHFSGSRLDVAIANVGQFNNSPIFSLGATFPVGAAPMLFGSGTDLQLNGSLPFPARNIDIRAGTAASPDTTLNLPPFKISRSLKILDTDPFGSDSDPSSSSLILQTVVDTNSDRQGIGLYSVVNTYSTTTPASGKSADAFPIFGIGTVVVGPHLGGGAYLEGKRLVDTGQTNGAEIRTTNLTATDSGFSLTGHSNCTSLWVTSGGTASNGAGISLYATNSPTNQYEAGIIFTTGSVRTVGFQDNSSSATSIIISGTHATAAQAIAAGSGMILSGGVASIFGNTSCQLELQGNNNFIDGLLAMGSVANTKTYTARIRNSTGQTSIGIVGVANDLLTGAAAGDGIWRTSTANRAIHMGGTVICLTASNANVLTSDVDHTFAAHIVSTASGTPASSALGTNVTSVTFTGNDVRGTIAVVMSGALAANTRISTNTFAISYGATSPKVTLVDQTSAVGLTIVNFYVSAQSTGVSFDLACDQALAAGTYTIDYIVIG